MESSVFWQALAVGAVSSLLASAVFWAGLQRLRPRLTISPQITRTGRDAPDTGFRYRFKVVNRSRRAAVDVQIHAYLDVPRKVLGGDIRVLKKLPVNTTAGSVIPGKHKKDREARHARRVRFDVDLDEIWKDDQHSSIRVRVYARDSASGYMGECEQVYPLRKCIQDGTFQFGDSMKIESVDK